MKRKSMVCISALVVLQLSCSSLWARPTTAYEAKMVVTGWLKTDARPLGMTLGRKVMMVETFTNDYEQLVYYIVYLQKPGSAGTEPSGFVIVPADDLAEPIIGFVNGGTYDPSLENPLGALVTYDLNGRITAARSRYAVQAMTEGSHFAKSREMGPAVTKTQSKWNHFIKLSEARSGGISLMGLISISDVRVAPLLKTKWGQYETCGRSCFNYYTPDNYPCGCVATNVAQLVHYHRHPGMGIGTDEFTIEVDDVEQTVSTRGGDGNGGLYQWDLMVPEPGCKTTLEERQAIGALCYDASVAIKTHYSAEGSGSNFLLALLALTTTFKCKNAVLGINWDPVSEGFTDIDQGLNDMVNPNLDASYPVVLGIFQKSQKYGHSVLCDGYGYKSSTLYHHLNFGWDGFNDLWYNLPDVSSDPPFNVVDQCIYNIFTSHSGEIISGRVTEALSKPLSDAMVTAHGPGGPYTAVTDSNGIYALVGVRSDSTYTVSVRKSGHYFTAPQVVTTEVSTIFEPISGNKWAIDFGESSIYALEDFETGDFSKVSWERSGAVKWTIVSQEKYSGTYSARAGRVDDDESTTLKVTIDCLSGNITFRCKVSSEPGADYLKFYIDGVEMDKWSGREDWTMVSFPVTAGIRTFEWVYSKDYSESGNNDTAWIDDIGFPVETVPVIASNPDPPDDAVEMNPNTSLSWTQGLDAVTQDVYLGTDEAAVANATTSSGQFKGSQSDIIYTPGPLMMGTRYYWRVDEVDDSATHKGNLWSFTTSDFVVLDDFELYDAGQNQIWYAWKDGRGCGTPDDPPYHPGNQTGSAVGDEMTASCTEENIVGEGNQAMPYFYDNDKHGSLNYSEATFTLSSVRDWTKQDISMLSLWFRGNPPGFVEAPAGTYTMAAAGSDIWDEADEFRYAYKQLSGAGTIEAQVLSVEYTDPWAKAGVMIRETLEPGSKFAAVYITPGNGCRFQARTSTDSGATSDTPIATSKQKAVNAPYRVKLERDASNKFRGYYSSDGVSWQSMAWNPRIVSMNANVYIGLALTSHDARATCVAEFSDVKTTGTVNPLTWTNEAIGATMISNTPERMYVAVANNGGTPAVVYHDDPAATQISTWTEWLINTKQFADQGVDLTDVEIISIGFGDRSNPQPGGSGKVYFDDIRLYRPR